MKILHITRGLIKTSGISVFVAELAGAQMSAGHDVTVAVRWHPYYPVRCGVRLLVSRRQIRQLESCEKPDFAHVHGIWSLHSVVAMMWCLYRDVPYVVSPHGGLMPRVFTIGRMKKQLAYRLLLRPLIQRAIAVHCTAKGELDAIEALGLTPKKIVAPLGCRLPQLEERATGGALRTVLFLSRISEEKGLIALLDAWKAISASGWRLTIAGPDWRGYEETLRQKVLLEKIENVAFVGNADEERKDALYRAADVFVLPSPMENFSMVVLDAMAYGVPVICTRGTPWREVEERCCGRWIGQGVEALKEALHDLMSLSPEQRAQMGRNGRSLAEEKYNWRVVEETIDDSISRVLTIMV